MEKKHPFANLKPRTVLLGLRHLPSFFTTTAVQIYLVLLAVSYVAFPNKLPVLWIIFGVVEVAFFFYLLNYYSTRWLSLSTRYFERRIFFMAFVFRAIYAVGMYFFYVAQTGQPFEFDAGDSSGYHEAALWIKDLYSNDRIGEFFKQSAVSDSGYPLWLAVIYTFLYKSIILARLFHALMSAWMTVLIYRLAKRNFDEATARLAAIMAVVLPNFIYYCGLHTKETVMIFFLVAFAERADHMLRQHEFSLKHFLVVVLLGSSLFFFRTVLAASAWFALFTAMVFSNRRGMATWRKTSLIIWFGVAALFVITGKIKNEVEGYLQDRSTNQSIKMESMTSSEHSNSLAKYGSAVIFLPISIAAPFPTLVNIPSQQNTMMINGNMFTRNIYAFFIIIALLTMYRQKIFRSHLLVLALPASYLVVLANSGFALSERFHLPLLPFLIILAAFGITQINSKNIKWYVPYVIIIAALILFWNWFKLAGRGML